MRNSLDVHVISDRTEVKRKIWKVSIKNIIERILIIIFLVCLFGSFFITLIQFLLSEM